MAKVEEKKPIVAEISEVIQDAQSVILVAYSGINVAADTALRKEMREAGVTYKVFKNTMMNFAFLRSVSSAVKFIFVFLISSSPTSLVGSTPDL